MAVTMDNQVPNADVIRTYRVHYLSYRSVCCVVIYISKNAMVGNHELYKYFY